MYHDSGTGVMSHRNLLLLRQCFSWEMTPKQANDPEAEVDTYMRCPGLRGRPDPFILDTNPLHG